MPELPEVEALAQTLASRTEGMHVARFEVAAISALKTFDPPAAATVGCAVLGWHRLGKHLVMDLADPDGQPLHVVTHLGRAGWVRWREDPPTAPAGFARRGGTRGSAPGLAIRIGLAGDPQAPAPTAAVDFTEAGTQKRLAVNIVASPQDVPRVASLGPDPLDPDFDEAALAAILAAAGRAQLKGVLRDQSRIAGIGNAYSDEILHSCRLSPYTPSSSLRDADLSALHASIRQVLSTAVTVALATDPSSLKAEKKASMAVHGRTGLPCPRCGDPIREVSFADSSLQYCSTCQTGGRILADRRMSRLLK